MSKTVVVTGGCGFIGSHLGALLVENDYDVILFDNFIRGKESNVEGILDREQVELIRGDVRDYEVIEEPIEGADFVVHLAASNLNRSIAFPSESLAVNVMGTNNVLEACSQHDIDKVLFASSASVYGDQDIPMRETDPVSPKTPYGVSKFAGEGLLNFYADRRDLDYIAYRFFNVYGAGQDTDAYYTSVINVFIERIARGKPPVIHGSGEQSLDFVNVSDIARALRLGLEHDVSNEVFNVGSGESTTIATLAKTLIEIMDVDMEPEYQERDVLVSKRKASIQGMKDKLGFETKVSLKEGLSDVVDHVLGEMEETQ